MVLLDAEGNSPNGLTTADPPKRLLVTVKPGEWLRFRDKPRLVLGVEVCIATDGERERLSLGHLLNP